MKFLRRLLIVLAGLAVMVLVVGLMLPDRVHMERSIEIAAPPATVYGLVNNFRESLNIQVDIGWIYLIPPLMNLRYVA